MIPYWFRQIKPIIAALLIGGDVATITNQNLFLGCSPDVINKCFVTESLHSGLAIKQHTVLEIQKYLKLGIGGKMFQLDGHHIH